MQTIGAEINGVDTEFVIRQYSNSLFVLITQTGKTKNCIHIEKVSQGPADDQGFAPSEVVYKCTVKFGPDSLEDLAAVQYLSERVGFPDNTVLSICLTDHSPSTLTALVEILLKNKVW
ncbi:Uncharacterised conserved protein (DUF2372) [Nesidiocoris tenuis]|uniref:Uncharacterized conserved protein (DUF2372) n=1 Tax=Nesidiocoris tenuis TaxID=355587 RepID=A0ABN7AS06_9HEMI|nr:Uncharacterised conserved protein (DUF2372) [Nesidiocoris tenuis]